MTSTKPTRFISFLFDFFFFVHSFRVTIKFLLSLFHCFLINQPYLNAWPGLVYTIHQLPAPPMPPQHEMYVTSIVYSYHQQLHCYSNKVSIYLMLRGDMIIFTIYVHACLPAYLLSCIIMLWLRLLCCITLFMNI